MRLPTWGSPALAAMLAVGVTLVVSPVPAQAQSLMNPGPVVRPGRAPPPPPLPPPGLPGAAGNAATPAPSRPAESGLSPTDALFDAINRGDLVAARSAIGQGAQLDAKNLLGMTPLELAVDLNRNNIAFLLLSIEHEGHAAANSAGASPALSVPPTSAAVPIAGAAATGPRGAAGTGGSVEALLLAGQPASNARAVRASPRSAAEPAALPPGGSGSPNPAVGFLGFGPAAEVAAQN